METGYRCFFLSSDGHIRNVAEILANSDAEAIAEGQRLLEDGMASYDGFEVWNLARFVHRYRRKLD
jgi:hypothetical protein